MDKNVLAICPSRGRPILIREMIDTFLRTRNEGTDLVIYVAEDDPTLPDYVNTFKRFENNLGISLQWGPRKFIAQVYNEFAMANLDYKYFSTLNDDHVFITQDWDKKLIKLVEDMGGWGIAGADDLLTDWEKCKHPSGCVISSNIVRTLGYIMYPGLRHIGTDTFLAKIAEGIGGLVLTRDVVIEHRHWLNGRRPLDDNYSWVYGKEEQVFGWNAVQDYLFNHYEKDLQKLKEAMKK